MAFIRSYSPTRTAWPEELMNLDNESNRDSSSTKAQKTLANLESTLMSPVLDEVAASGSAQLDRDSTTTDDPTEPIFWSGEKSQHYSFDYAAGNPYQHEVGEATHKVLPSHKHLGETNDYLSASKKQTRTSTPVFGVNSWTRKSLKVDGGDNHRIVASSLNKFEIARLYRGYQIPYGTTHEPQVKGTYHCTLGCSWTHWNKANWQRHERLHYPPEIWVCSEPECLERTISSRVSLGEDLAQRHYIDHHSPRSKDNPKELRATRRAHAQRPSRLAESELRELHVLVQDSLFPKQCVFKYCHENFDKWEDRSNHMMLHLQLDDELIRKRITKHFGNEFDGRGEQEDKGNQKRNSQSKDGGTDANATADIGDDDVDAVDNGSASAELRGPYAKWTDSLAKSDSVASSGDEHLTEDTDNLLEYRHRLVDHKFSNRQSLSNASHEKTTPAQSVDGSLRDNLITSTVPGLEAKRDRKWLSCVFSGCERKRFGSLADLRRHKQSVHHIVPDHGDRRNWQCSVEGCRNADKVWLQLDIFRNHCRNCHKDEDLEELVKRSEIGYTLYDSLESCIVSDHIAFVSMILKDIPSDSIDHTYISHRTSWLEFTLKLYALQLGGMTMLRNQYETMWFILSQPGSLASSLRRAWQEPQFVTLNLPSAKKKVELDSALRDEARSLNTSYNSSKVHIDDLQTKFHWQQVTGSLAHSWLMTRLKQFSRLTIPVHDRLTLIGDAICQDIRDSLLFSNNYDIALTGHQHRVLFNVKWNFEKFLAGYGPPESSRSINELGSFLTLTSDGKNVQALTCSQYLQALWPKTGKEFLETIIRIVRDKDDPPASHSRSLSGHIQRGRLNIEITGSIQDVVELAQQLAWLGSVCQASSSHGQTQFCRPCIPRLIPQLAGGFRSDISFELIDHGLKDDAADCWQQLFYYPVVADGFPIAKRDGHILGLEISLGSMLSLNHAQHMIQYDNRLFVHGFSNVCSLTKHERGLSTWHFSENIGGEYISPLGEAGRLDITPGIHEILEDRHFVGWCSEFRYKAGTPDCSYLIEPSELSPSQDGGILSKTTVRQPKRIAEEHIWIVGDREERFKLSGQIFLEKIEWIHKRTVVLWDTENQKGWLVNGTSALLHLVLASLETRGMSSHSHSEFRQKALKWYPQSPEDAARNFLLDKNNLATPIYSHGGDVVNLKRRVEDVCSCLLLLFEIQISKVTQGGIVKNSLDGWDFLDVADSTHDPFDARTFPLSHDCSGWMNLLQDTFAVTLFGDNFGEIIAPVSSHLCKEWSALPSQKCLLAASIADLDLISRTYGGSKKATPRRLTKNTTWAILPNKFDKCDCSNSSSHDDLVQVLIPSLLFNNNHESLKDLCTKPSIGAVVFGPVNLTKWTISGDSLSSNAHATKRHRAESDEDGDSDSEGGNKDKKVRSYMDVDTLDVNASKQPRLKDYKVAIVCALRKELRAVRLLFDQEYQDPPFPKEDPQSYAFGRIHSYKIVAACLPGAYGTCNATRVTTELKRSFPKIQVCILVGIGAGVPATKEDVRLGDVVVSFPSDGHDGIIKYDFKKLMQEGEAKRLGTFKQPPEGVLSAINILASGGNKDDEPLRDYLRTIAEKDETYSYPGQDQDRLYFPDAVHEPGRPDCSSCLGLIERHDRVSGQPQIHYGLIASGDQLLKHARKRDKLYNTHKAICIEMEAAGVANVLPCLVVRGISDYADSHKHDAWHNYASAAAASYAKYLLGKARI